MSSFEKTVKLACKPKAAPPKAKYLDPIIAATWSEDGAVHDVCKALSPRFREPNSIVVFKALIVLHTMIRNGSTDNVLQYLSSSDVLRLRNVSSGTWEGYTPPENMQNYAKYLDMRIRAYRDLKHDAIRVQSESNRDLRNSQAVDEELEQASRSRRGKAAAPPPAPASSNGVQRSKTMAGRKLRIMTVEKGLLRETKVVQRMVDALVECRFYLDDLEDELNVTVLRMLVKDLLILFQACNEGVINVLEHYFEMSRIDATEALALYRHFCKQTERVVEYLGVAKKLQNLLNVPIPNLRHAPVSLAGALEEYLKDPNFEQNRIEYKTNKDLADKNAKAGVKGVVKAQPKAASPAAAAPETEASSSEPPPVPKIQNSQAMVDFFAAIESEQTRMFNPQTNSPTASYFQQQALQNPFALQQQSFTGAAIGAQAFGQPQLQPQATGFIMPQQTAFQPQGPSNPFGLGLQAPAQQAPSLQPQQGPSFQSFLAPQQTGFLQPQMTGANPFRQSTLFPQTTGMQAFGTGAGPAFGSPQNPTNPFPVQNQNQNLAQIPAFGQQQQPLSVPNGTQPSTSSSPFGVPSFTTPTTSPPIVAPFAQPAGGMTPSSNQGPPRSATAPLTGPAASSQQPMQPIKAHQTGSRNPFGIPMEPAPPVPKPPTLFELAMGTTNNQPQSIAPQPQQPAQTGAGTQANGSVISSVASAFAFGGGDSKSSGTSAFTTNPLNAQQTSSTTTGSTFSDTLFSSVSSQPTGASSFVTPSLSNSSLGSPLPRQQTGFSGVKAFKPSSSFGAQLLESLPPIPQSNPSTPTTSPPASSSSITSQPTGFPGLASQPTGLGGSSLGVGLRPQMTGGGAANPFRATMFSLSPPLPSNGTIGTGASTTPSFSGFSATGTLGGAGSGLGMGNGSTGMGASLFGGLGASNQQQQQQQQQGGGGSLI